MAISEASVNPPFSYYLFLMLLTYCIVANLIYCFAVSVCVAKPSLRLDTTISDQAYPVNYLTSVINNDR